jgi:class 3 adenylate cyclase
LLDRGISLSESFSHDTLSLYAEHIERLRWASILLDDDWRLVWVSPEMREFAGATGDAELGVGEHIVQAFFEGAMAGTVPLDSQVELFRQIAPFIAADVAKRGDDVIRAMPQAILELLRGVEPQEPPMVWSASLSYQNARLADGAVHPVNLLFMRVADQDGRFVGWHLLSFMAVRPNLVSLLARGDESMYERMARLVEPGQRQAAVLFCDLHGSGPLSRQLPSGQYFGLVRELWTAIDHSVARQGGIVGKHAGDGASAFFLVDDLGEPSAAAAAAITTAREVHERSSEVFRSVMDNACLMKVGLHWGANLYMGQLVPGGRLDVTALGDEVNEAARIQEAAAPHQTLASKQLIERLSAHDGSRLGLDPHRLSYTVLSELVPNMDKVIRDAGTIAVTVL